MDHFVKRLADALRMAEKAHADYEAFQPARKGQEWPEYYAQWLLDNTHLWSSGCEDASCEVHYPQDSGDIVG